jgi:uncharacterized SAM-binding protein YcdF (DUF218 family)
MFIFLSKFLPLFIYPLGLSCLLLILALFSRKSRRTQSAFILLAFLFLWAGGNRWIAFSVVRSLEWQFLPPAEIPSADVIVILGGGTDSADYPRPMVELSAAGDRVLYGALLYKQGKAPLLLLSGGNIKFLGDSSSTPAEQMAEILELTGVPQSALILETQSLNTYENALYSAKILKEKGYKQAILVTSAIHMPRSVALFRKQGIEVIPAPTDFKVTELQWQNLTQPSLEAQLINFIPSSTNLEWLTATLKEYIGILVYRLRGWI